MSSSCVIIFTHVDPNAPGYMLARPTPACALAGLSANRAGDLVWRGGGQRSEQQQAADWLWLLAWIQENILSEAQRERG